MSTNKNAILRYQVLDRCFRNPGRKYYWEDLLEECNKALLEFNGPQSQINRRQLFNDLLFMESEAGWSIPLVRHKDGRKVYYRYEDLSFSINNQPLNETEINQLQSALLILSRFQGLPQLEWIKELFPRIQKGLELPPHETVVAFDENPFLKGMSHFGELFNAIIYKKVLLIEYQDFKAPAPYHITLHPYFLKQYNNRWFVFGLNPYYSVPDWSMALDRILSIQQSTAQYIPNTTIDWNEYFEDIIGVTKPKDAEPEKIRFWFHPETAPYILTKPFHGSQKKVSHDDTGLIIEIELIPNFEFYQQVLSFGHRVICIWPNSVQSDLARMISQAINNYKKI